MKQIHTPFALTHFELPVQSFDETRTDSLSIAKSPLTVRTPNIQSAHAAQLAFARCVRQFLDREGQSDWRLFQTDRWSFNDDMYEAIEQTFPDKRWSRSEAASELWMYDTIEYVRSMTGNVKPWNIKRRGFLLIPEFEILLARTSIVDANNTPTPTTLVGSTSVEAVHRFQMQVARTQWRLSRQQRRWTVLYDKDSYDDGSMIDTGPGFDTLEVSDSLLNVLHRELVGFFRPEVRQLHRDLKIPYARRALLHGPPGTGKTSVCRAIAKACPGVAAYHLMPANSFDDDDLKAVFDRFCAQVPSLLLIEDLDTLVGNNSIKLSNLLNLLDGANSAQGDGVLILATTNFPENLPQSLANRPGRFVPIEVPLPDETLRRRFVARAFEKFPVELIDMIVRKAEGLSFAHLQEIVLMSGLVALKDGRTERTAADIEAALDHVVKGHDEAGAGFIPKPSGRFGFAAPRE